MATLALHPTVRAVVAVFSLAPLSEPTQQPYKSETNGLCNFLVCWQRELPSASCWTRVVPAVWIPATFLQQN